MGGHMGQVHIGQAEKKKRIVVDNYSYHWSSQSDAERYKLTCRRWRCLLSARTYNIADQGLKN